MKTEDRVKRTVTMAAAALAGLGGACSGGSVDAPASDATTGDAPESEPLDAYDAPDTSDALGHSAARSGS